MADKFVRFRKQPGRTDLKIENKNLQNQNSILISESEELKIDSVTGLRPRKVFDLERSRYLSEIKRKEDDGAEIEHYGVVILDIGDFKNFNDTYGHEIGDQVLSIVGEGFRLALRESDITGRFGGDEFIAILTNVIKGSDPETVSKELTERINRHIGEKTGGQDLGINVDVGIAYGTPSDDFNVIQKRADDRMYTNKAKRKETNV